MKTATKHIKKLVLIIALSSAVTAAIAAFFGGTLSRLAVPYTGVTFADLGIAGWAALWIFIFDLSILIVESMQSLRRDV